MLHSRITIDQASRVGQRYGIVSNISQLFVQVQQCDAWLNFAVSVLLAHFQNFIEGMVVEFDITLKMLKLYRGYAFASFMACLK